MIKQGYRDYLKNIVISVGLMCLVYFYLLANFWWGNHDWGYLKDGVSVESGLFEARYSQHLFTIFFLDSHVLPVFLFFVGFLCIGLIGCLVGKYLEVDKKYWFLLAFFIGINPHIFALFYFVYLFFSFIAWSMVGVLLLFTIEGKLKWYSFCVGLLGYILVLGSYPPNLAFVFVLFVAKRLLCFEKKEESFGEICKRGVFFAGQIICAGLAYKLIYKQMINMHLINQDMYNIQLKSLREVVESLPLEVINSISQMFERFSFMGWWYVLVLFVLVAIAVVGTVGKCEQKSLAVLMILGMFLVSRFAFIVAARTDVSPFRLVYWGRLGIYVFALSFLFREKKVWVRNISFLALSVVLYCFSITDFEIQKIMEDMIRILYFLV